MRHYLMQLLPQAVRELGETTAELARKLGITQPAVSLSVRRGERLVKEMGLELREG
jgi:predicted transcriptional regulator